MDILHLAAHCHNVPVTSTLDVMALNEHALIENWREQKLAHNFHRLSQAGEFDGEFRRRPGPSSYAYVKFLASPAADLSLDFSVQWPEEFDSEYSLRIRNAIGEAVVDRMLGAPSTAPYRGCSLVVVGFKWDPVGGSELAVHHASLLALESLCTTGQWEWVTGGYRKYT